MLDGRRQGWAGVSCPARDRAPGRLCIRRPLEPVLKVQDVHPDRSSTSAGTQQEEFWSSWVRSAVPLGGGDFGAGAGRRVRVSRARDVRCRYTGKSGGRVRRCSGRRRDVYALLGLNGSRCGNIWMRAGRRWTQAFACRPAATDAERRRPAAGQHAGRLRPSFQPHTTGACQ